MALAAPAAKLEGVQPDCGDYYMVALLEQQGQLDDGAPSVNRKGALSIDEFVYCLGQIAHMRHLAEGGGERVSEQRRHAYDEGELRWRLRRGCQICTNFLPFPCADLRPRFLELDFIRLTLSRYY